MSDDKASKKINVNDADQPQAIPPEQAKEPEHPEVPPENGSAPANEPQADQAAGAMPTPDELVVESSKTYGLTGLQKEVLANFLNIQNLNQFQLRSYLQLLAESQWQIKADQFCRFGLNLDKNEVTVEFLKPKNGKVNGAAGLEAAPPAQAK